MIAPPPVAPPPDGDAEATASRRSTGRNRILSGIVAGVLAAAATLVFFLRPATAPRGYLEDFVSLALNSYCVSRTGADEYGVRLPLVAFRSFGDFKSTANLYGLAAWYRLFPTTLASARVYSLLLGYTAILVVFALLTREGTLARLRSWPLAAALLALTLLSPWALVTDRVLVEITSMDLALALAMAGTLALLNRPGSIWAGILTGAATGLLAYNYSPAKVVYLQQVPLVLLACAVPGPGRDGGRRLARYRGLLAAVCLSVALGLPHLWDLAHGGQGVSRFWQVEGGFSPSSMARGLGANLGLDFLFLHGDPNPHHHHGRGGMLNLFFLPWIAVGIVDAVRRIRRRQDRFSLYLLGLTLAAFIPAALARSSPPHALRSHLGLLPLVCLAARGLAAARDAQRSGVLQHRAWAVALILSSGLGFAQAADGALHFFDSYSRRNLWCDTGPHPRWKVDPGRAAHDDHRPETIGERFQRATAGDLGYCGAGAAPGSAGAMIHHSSFASTARPSRR